MPQATADSRRATNLVFAPVVSVVLSSLLLSLPLIRLGLRVPNKSG